MKLFGKNRIFSFFQTSTEDEKQVVKASQKGSSNNYSISRNEYYIERLFPKTILGFNKIFSQDLNLHLTTNKLIDPKEYPLNSTYSQIVSLQGKPRIEIVQDPSYRVVFYKKTTQNSRSLTQLHFLNNILIYISTSFSDLTTKEKSQLFEALQNKYNIIGLKNSGIIIDKAGNKITVDDDIYTRVSYLTGNQEILEILKNKCLTLSAENSIVNNPFNDFI